MSFIEFLGFVISLAALIFLAFKRAMENRQRRLNPEEYARREKEREENLRRFMRERGIDFGDQANPASPKPKQKKQPKPPMPMNQEVQIKLREAHREAQRQQILQTQKNIPVQYGDYVRETASDKKQSLAAFDSKRLSSDLKPTESYEVVRDDRVVLATQLIRSLKTPRDMLIIKEIFDKPLSMRE